VLAETSGVRICRCVIVWGDGAAAHVIRRGGRDDLNVPHYYSLRAHWQGVGRDAVQSYANDVVAAGNTGNILEVGKE
jgi:hypothetical protein